MRVSLLKTILIYSFSLLGLLMASVNFLPKEMHTFAEAFPRLTLGLDLKGGSYLLLEVDSNTIRKETIDNLREEARNKLREAKLPTSSIQVNENGVFIKLRNVNDIQKMQTTLQSLEVATTNPVIGTVQKDVELKNIGTDTFALILTEQGFSSKLSKAVEQSIAIVERRVNELGTVEPTIQRQGADRILLQVPGLQDPKRLRELLGQTAKLTFRLVDETLSQEALSKGRVPPELEILPTLEPLSSVSVRAVQKSALVSGEDLIDAQTTFDSRTNEAVVSFRFNTYGARKFGTATEQNVGKPFAIVLDNKIISAPVIREPIRGGAGQISGNFTTESANDLAILLRAGALPAPLNILEERTVGPAVGADSIASGKLAALVGIALVSVFMILTYGKFGVFALIALVGNIGFLITILSIFGSTLTLPGIAGIVLTMGMAVDSNVLIYERIREELRSGRSVISSLEAGFERALATIIDSNLTTLIAGLVLFLVGSGPVKGFAITISLGIITTLFTAYTLTRVIIANWYSVTRPKILKL